MAVAALTAATAGGAYADNLPTTTDTGAIANATEEVADGDTRYTYTGKNGTGVLGDETSTRYSGRVWTDKTVTTTDQTFKDPNDSESQPTTPVIVKNDSDFLITYSVLATSTEVTDEHPEDTVFVLDFSKTMNEYMDGEEPYGDTSRLDETRIALMLNALDGTIWSMAQANPENRVGIVVFYGESEIGRTKTLLPMTKTADLFNKGLDIPFDDPEPITDIMDPDYTWDANEGIERPTYPEAGVGKQGNLYTTEHELFTITKFWFVGDDFDYSKSKVRCNFNSIELQTGSYTPIQGGIYVAMTMLEEAARTREEGTRPNVVLMSDGEPNAVYKTGPNWYENLNTWTYYPQTPYNQSGDRSHASAYFATVMMAGYLNERIEEVYETDCRFFTLGISENYTDQFNFVLDPGPYLDGEKTATGDGAWIVERSINAWDRYASDGDSFRFVDEENGASQGLYDNSQENYVTIDDAGSRYGRAYNDDEKLTPMNLDYADKTYRVQTVEDLEDAFADIMSQILATPKVPTDTDGSHMESGWIEYEDQIGKYMQVKDVKTLIYMGTRFNRQEPPTTTTNPDKTVTQYRFAGQISNPVYPDEVHNLDEIKITVTTENSGFQTLRVRIPASAIPIRVNEIILKSDGSIENKVSEDLPLRLCYTVGLQTGINRIDDVSEDYVMKNKADDGTVLFYSNAFTKDSEGQAQAGATVTFTPALDNPFYYIQENTPLYVNGAEGVLDQSGSLGEPATDFDENKTYYFPITYYEGTTKVERVIARHGIQLVGYTKTIDRKLYIKQGAPRLGNLQDLTAAKGDDNRTKTDDNYREPTWDAQNKRFVVYLGNNGRLGIKPTEPGTVDATVRKTLEGREWGDNETFRFTITPSPTNRGPLPTGHGVTDNKDGTATLAIGKPDDGDTNTASLTFTFPAETNFDENGKAVYTYEVTEIRGDQPSIDWDGHTATITITVKPDGADPDLALDVDPPVYDNQTASEEGNGSTDAAAFTNTFRSVSSLPLTGGDMTARNLLTTGGGVLTLAGAAWLLARRRRV